jgi:hypothetical protein
MTIQARTTPALRPGAALGIDADQAGAIRTEGSFLEDEYGTRGSRNCLISGHVTSAHEKAAALSCFRL